MTRSTTPPWLCAPDERAQMGRTAGVLWLLSGMVVMLASLLPGMAPQDERVSTAIGVFALAYGIGSITDRIPWSRTPIEQHLIAAFTAIPLLVLVQWNTGGASTYVLPLMGLPMFFAAYFYPPRYAWPLLVLTTLALAAPFAYDRDAISSGFAARYGTFAVAALTLGGVVLHLKARLLDAERVQRTMAFRDPLTSVGNRRAFDAALAAAVDLPASSHRQAAVLFLDLDRFKQVNDRYGYAAGDRALRRVASHCRAAVRPSDTVARLGGDEFAIVAPGAGAEGAARLAALLKEAIRLAHPADGAEPLDATVTWALLGEDGSDGAELLRIADRRLTAAKRSGRRAAIGL